MNSCSRILYLENDIADAKLVQDTLERNGIVCDVTRVDTESRFVAALQQGGFDVILADYTLPSFDGLSALRLARQQKPDLPFIFVSGTPGEEVAVEALKVGATDYVLKSGLSRLVPSVQRALRESSERAELRRSEEALRQNEAHLREQANLLSLTHDAIFVRDMKGTIKYWNRGAEELYGWTADETVGKVAHELLKTVFPVPLDQIEQQLVHSGRWEGELVHTKKFGTQVIAASRWSLQRDAKGAPIAILETNNDISDRKRAEQAREEAEERWRAAFDSNPTMYFMVDSDGTIILVSAFGGEQLGYNIGELIGQPVLNVFYEPDRQAVQKHAEECFKQPGRMMTWEARKIRKDGTMLWVRETGSAVSLKKRPVLLVVCEDITEQKRAEEAARKSESELRDLIENVPAMVFIALPGPLNRFASRGWREYTGMSSEDTTEAGWQSVVHPDDLQRHIEKWRVCSATGEPYEDEARFRRAADGEYRWFLVRAVPLRDAAGKILKWYGVLTDIEDRKRTEALIAGEKRVLELVAKGEALPDILDSLCRMVEVQASGALASILLVEGDRLKHGGAPSLPQAYTEAIDGVLIGPSVGSCGTAAYCGKQVIVEDIASDPLWVDYRDAALPHSLRACWSTPVFSSQGKVIATFAMYYREPRSPRRRDQEIIEQITNLAGVAIERKRTYDQLQRSEAYLAEGQRVSHTGSFGWNVQTGEIRWSEETFRIFQCDPSMKPNVELVLQRAHPEDVAFVRQEIERASQDRKDIGFEHRLLMPDGSVKHVRVAGRARTDKPGELEFVGAVTDITGAKRAEEALRRSEAYLAEAQRLSHSGSWAYEAGGGRVYWSEENLRIWGFDPRRGAPDLETVEQRMHPEDRDREVEYAKNAAGAGRDFVQEFRIVLPDGNVRHIQAVGHPVLDANGEVIEVAGTHVDVTERKRTEKERERLLQLEGELAHMNRVVMLGELASSLAHEINQPITATITSAKACLRWLAHNPPDLERARAAAMRIEKDGNRAGEVIQRLRAFSRTGAPPQRELVDVNEVIGEMLVLLRDEATAHSISLRTELAPQLPPVMADRVQLQQVLMNLMLNGIEAMRDAPGELTIRSQRTDNRLLLISVSDTGVGIPSEKVDVIFNAFYTTKAQGTGMGLAISRSIVEAHGGRLRVSPNAQRGATFHFTLPAEVHE